MTRRRLQTESVEYADLGKVRDGVPTLRLYLPKEAVKHLGAKAGDKVTLRMTSIDREKVVVIRMAKG